MFSKREHALKSCYPLHLKCLDSCVVQSLCNGFISVFLVNSSFGWSFRSLDRGCHLNMRLLECSLIGLTLTLTHTGEINWRLNGKL